MSLLAELKRRKVFRVAGAYLVVGWLLIQVAATVLPQFDVPTWAPRLVTLLVALGFPIALVMAWALDVTPEGVKLDPMRAGSKRVIAVAAVLVALALGWYFRGQAGKPVATLAIATPVPAAPTASAAPQKSIAVLAFTDLSPQHDQEYFSDGMAEEILNALAQVKDMKVAGRTSSFFYKGRNEDLRSIGKTLGVANVLEGSVRKQGDQVRITAQLVRSADGFHLWSETYDGDLKDVFALQEKIARAITNQLQVVLQGEQKTRLVPVTTSNPEAYALYLQATAIFNRRDGAHFDDAVLALQQAIRLDPKYARAYSRLATVYIVMPTYTDTEVHGTQVLALKNADIASGLDPTLAEPYAVKGLAFSQFPGHFIEQHESCDRAIQLDPDDVTSNFWCGLHHIKTGYTARGTALIDHALALDPLLPNALRWRGILYMYDGDLGHAQRLLESSRDVGLLVANRELADVAAARGDAATAATLWVSGVRILVIALPDETAHTIAKGIFGDAAARERAVAVIDAYLAEPREHISGVLPPALMRLGQPARALELMHHQVMGDNTDSMGLLWSPRGREMRTLPEFQPFLRDFGFIDLWNKYGPPDLCRKNDKGDYICQ